ncbi:hypothetical protein FKM82_030732, partial [Ascaphus truei]
LSLSPLPLSLSPTSLSLASFSLASFSLFLSPQLHYLRLPKDISEDHVILMDCTVSTGAAAMMAVRVLLDHEVPEEKIFLLSLLMAELGVHSVAYAFPRVRILTTAVDKKVNDLFRIIPGIG